MPETLSHAGLVWPNNFILTNGFMMNDSFAPEGWDLGSWDHPCGCCMLMWPTPPVKTQAQVSFSSWNQEGPESTSPAVNTLYTLSHIIAGSIKHIPMWRHWERTLGNLFLVSPVLLQISLWGGGGGATFNLYLFAVMNHEYNRFSDYCNH